MEPDVAPPLSAIVEDQLESDVTLSCVELANILSLVF